MTKETRKFEIENDYLYFRKGSNMTPMDFIYKFCWLGGQNIAADPSKNMDLKEAKQKLMELIFENTGIKIGSSGGISTADDGGLQNAVYKKQESGGYKKIKAGGKVKINRVLKMESGDFDLVKMIEKKDYSTDLHRVQLKKWDVNVPTTLSRVTTEDFERAIKASQHHADIAGNAALKESLKYAFNGVHRKDNPKATKAKISVPTKVDLDEARSLI